MTADTNIDVAHKSLIVLKKGIYMNANMRGKRIHIADETPALIIDRHGPYARVAIEGDKVLLVHEKNCESPK
tara:strand:+ start:475 stop:690 length:216 start_codon:yes stop_codon:yes gene_type:complete